MGASGVQGRNWKVSLKAVGVGAVTGTVIGLVAFRFLTSRQYPGMGSVLFLLVPIAAGFSIAMVARKPDTTTAAAVLSVISSLVLLIALGAEGMLCAVLAFPIIAAGLFIGLGIGMLFRKLVISHFANQTTPTSMLLLPSSCADCCWGKN
jgi:hypothetical protein